MKIYIAHSREYNYQAELYAPIRQDATLPQADIILPHEEGYDIQQDRDFYRQLDLIIAEVSYPAIGLGIELGWAKDDNVPVVCVYQPQAKVSGSLRAVTGSFCEYHNADELIKIIQDQIAHVRSC